MNSKWLRFYLMNESKKMIAYNLVAHYDRNSYIPTLHIKPAMKILTICVPLMVNNIVNKLNYHS